MKDTRGMGLRRLFIKQVTDLRTGLVEYRVVPGDSHEDNPQGGWGHMAPTFYRNADGRTYWQDPVDGAWVGAPTFADGTPDVDNASHLVDLDLERHEIEALSAMLDHVATGLYRGV